MRPSSTMAYLAAALAAPLILSSCASSNSGTGSGSAPHSSSSSVGPEGSDNSTPVPNSQSPEPATTSARPVANPQWCVDGEITVSSHADSGGAAAGHNDVVLGFTNSSSRTCVLYGYPGADALNAGGHVVAHAARSLTGYLGGSYTGLHDVVLIPGGTASAILEGDIGDGGADCDSGVSLLVTPPNLYHSSPIAAAPYVCGLTIHPVVAGSTGR